MVISEQILFDALNTAFVGDYLFSEDKLDESYREIGTYWQILEVVYGDILGTNLSI